MKVGTEHWWNGSDRGRSSLYYTYRLDSYRAVNIHRPHYNNRGIVCINVIMRCVRATTVAVEKQYVLLILNVCL